MKRENVPWLDDLRWTSREKGERTDSGGRVAASRETDGISLSRYKPNKTWNWDTHISMPNN